jgi:NAD(P)-dependent dehydrogenase (short-subunit alcohol dehydrogenase family)
VTSQQKGWLTAAGVLAAAITARHQWRERHAITLVDRVVLITGGSRGLGLALARTFVARGARVALVARHHDELERAAAELRARGADVLTIAADVRLQRDVERAIAQTVAYFGALDVLVNNAGIIAVGPMEQMTIDDYANAMRVHYWGPLYATLAALPHLRRARDARVVNIASIGGRIAVPHLAPYSGSKFALVGLSDAFRAELTKDGILVTTVLPGLMRTGSHVNATFKGDEEAEYAWFAAAASTPLLSTSAVHAAEQIVDACRRGEPTITVGVSAQVASFAHGLAPGFVNDVMAWACRVLPAPQRSSGIHGRQGFELKQTRLPKAFANVADRATTRYNQNEPALPIEAPADAEPAGIGGARG